MGEAYFGTIWWPALIFRFDAIMGWNQQWQWTAIAAEQQQQKHTINLRIITHNTHTTHVELLWYAKKKRSRGVRVDGHKHCLCLGLGTLYDAVLCIFMLPMNFHCIHFVLYNTDFLFFAVTQTNCRVFFSPLSFSAVASSLICIPHTDFKANTFSYILNENYNNIKNDYNL